MNTDSDIRLPDLRIDDSTTLRAQKQKGDVGGVRAALRLCASVTFRSLTGCLPRGTNAVAHLFLEARVVEQQGMTAR